MIKHKAMKIEKLIKREIHTLKAFKNEKQRSMSGKRKSKIDINIIGKNK